MRVAPNIKPNVDRINKVAQGKHSPQLFADMMQQSTTKLKDEMLTRLLSSIEEQGQQLTKKMTFEHLREYKKRIQQLLEESVHHGLDLQHKQGRSSGGKSKTYKIVTAIDQKLVELTDEILEKEQKSTRILSLVGEIKGLLIDLQR